MPSIKSILKFYCLSFLIVFSIGCKEQTPTSSTFHIRISKIIPDSIYPFDLVTIFGENLGSFDKNSFIQIDSNFVIHSFNCTKWNNNFIQFYAPKNFASGKLKVIAYGKDTSNSLLFNYFPYPKIEFVVAPAGKFQMGSNSGLAYEQPVHEVELSHDFWISKYEITQKQWLAVMDTNPSIFVGLDLPVANIDWKDAIVFCNRLSKMLGFDTCYSFYEGNVFWDTIANGFRLPTEAEWEYACRAGTTTEFAGNGNPLDMGWFDLNSGGKPHPPGRKNPNDWGIYDMHGNVWEWCWDWFEPFYYSNSPKTNPIGPPTGKTRVVRGGSWNKGTTFGRSSSRAFPEDQKTNFGFRIVRTIFK